MTAEDILGHVLRENPAFLDEMITSKEAARFCGTTDKALAQLRYRKEGPAYIRVNDRQHVRYTRRDLLKWVEHGRRHTRQSRDLPELELER